MREYREPPPPFGPVYNVEGAGLKKFRKAGIIGKAYGEAVLEAVRVAQRKALKGGDGPPPPRPREGRAILEEIAAQHKAALAAAPARERRARKPQVWRAMYEAAMAAKRQREAAALALAA
jgi:hypothetical protein